MEKKLMEKKLEVSYVYDPERLLVECDVMYGDARDGFCAMFDEVTNCETIHEFINGFVQYLKEKDDIMWIKNTDEEKK